jgi:glucose-6-phosphate 1-dehydrogenase
LGFFGARAPKPDQLVIKLDPYTGVRISADARRADAEGPETVNLDVDFAEAGGEGPAPYEVLLHAAMQGLSTRFKRQDSVEEAWRVMQPLVDAPPPVHPYAPGSWGPKAADDLVADVGGWQDPWS